MEKLVSQVIAYISTIQRPKDWVLKLFSLLFALFLWYFVVGEDKVDMNVSIPVEIVNLPRDLIISNQFKKNLDVAVTGQRSLIRGIANQHISRTIDLSHATPGNVIIQNEPDSINFPWGINVLRIQPSNITFVLDRLIQKKMPIKVTMIGDLPDGLTLKSMTLEPEFISITGPESILQDEYFLKTIPVDISLLKSFETKQVTLDLKPAIADLIGEPAVTVQFTIEKKRKEQLITGVPVQFASDPGENYSLAPPTVDIMVELSGDKTKEERDLSNMFQATVDIADLHSEAPALQVKITPTTKEKDIRFLSVSPATVTLEINPANEVIKK